MRPTKIMPRQLIELAFVEDFEVGCHAKTRDGTDVPVLSSAADCTFYVRCFGYGLTPEELRNEVAQRAPSGVNAYQVTDNTKVGNSIRITAGFYSVLL